MKFKAITASLLAVGLLAACGTDDQTSEGQEATETETASESTDATTTASIVAEEQAFVEAVGEDGTWIIATLNDLTIEEDVVVAGEFHDKGDEANDIYRKIEPYTQDEDHNITESFTVTVPQLTVQSENLNFQGGTLAGDVYVEADGFQLHESATIDGNLIFADEEVEGSVTIDGEVTGATEIE